MRWAMNGSRCPRRDVAERRPRGLSPRIALKYGLWRIVFAWRSHTHVLAEFLVRRRFWPRGRAHAARPHDPRRADRVVLQGGRQAGSARRTLRLWPFAPLDGQPT